MQAYTQQGSSFRPLRSLFFRTPSLEESIRAVADPIAASNGTQQEDLTDDISYNISYNISIATSINIWRRADLCASRGGLERVLDAGTGTPHVRNHHEGRAFADRRRECVLGI